MHIRLAVEDMEPAHWVAWALDLPACYSSAATAEEALARAPQRVAGYFSWLKVHDARLPEVHEPLEVDLVETFHSFPSGKDAEYIVNAFFADDRRPLGYWDVELALRLLEWTRRDLMEVIGSLPREIYTRPIEGERQDTLEGIVNHNAAAENWYLSHLGCGLELRQLAASPLEKIALVRTHTRQKLADWIGDGRVTQNYDEHWSARKVLRRTLWHERDHTQQIQHYLEAIAF